MHIQFPVNNFTSDEWPMSEPADSNDFSIGEEQSLSVVTSLAWSPSGLARHGRSVLAILTSNLVLSFWVSSSDPTISVNWRRVLVVNKSIQKSWRQRHMPTDNPFHHRRKLRVRNMAWAPKIHPGLLKDAPPSHAEPGQFLLAVSNDDCDIMILLVTSPFLCDSTTWDVKIVKIIFIDQKGPRIDGIAATEKVEMQALDTGSLSKPISKTYDEEAGREQTSSVTRPSLFNSAIKAKRYVDHIAWSPWIFDASTQIILSLTHSGARFHCRLDLSFIFPAYTALLNVPRFKVKQIYKCNDENVSCYSCSTVWHKIVSSTSICPHRVISR